MSAKDLSEQELDLWATQLCAALEIDADFDLSDILDLAADAAHNVIRPAAPLTTFLAGFAAGRAGGTRDDVEAAIHTAAELCEQRTKHE